MCVMIKFSAPYILFAVVNAMMSPLPWIPGWLEYHDNKYKELNCTGQFDWLNFLNRLYQYSQSTGTCTITMHWDYLIG